MDPLRLCPTHFPTQPPDLSDLALPAHLRARLSTVHERALHRLDPLLGGRERGQIPSLRGLPETRRDVLAARDGAQERGVLDGRAERHGAEGMGERVGHTGGYGAESAVKVTCTP